MKKLLSALLILGMLCPLAAAEDAPAAQGAEIVESAPAAQSGPADEVPAPAGADAGKDTAPAGGADAGTEATPTDGAGTGSETTPENGAGAGSETTPESGAGAGGETTPESGVGTGGETTPESGADAGSETTPESGADAGGGTSPESGADAGGETTSEGGETDAPVETPEPALEGYLLDGDGAKLEGGPLGRLLNLPGALRVCVSTRRVVKVEDFLLARLREIEFLPDSDVATGDYRVVLSASESLRDEFTPERIDTLPDDAVGDLYIWLREELPAPEETPAPGPGRKLGVEAENLVQGAWSCAQPSFALSGIGPEDENCAYAAIILDERIAVLSEDIYLPREEGVYTLRFAILDGMGDIVDRSEKYTLWLDFTPPELSIEPDMERDYAMNLAFSDARSGVDALSLDGGASWIALDGAQSYAYAAGKRQVFAPGMILLRDAAGNVAANGEEIVLEKLPSMSGGGGGGGGSAAPKKQHARGDGDDALYAAYELELPEGAVEALELGGEALELGLSLEDGGHFAEPAAFEARLLRWAREGTQDEGAEADTLALRAQDVDGEAEEYVWRINGAVLRKLYNSDVRYLLLEARGAALSLPTVGFVAGTRYAELKMEGVSTAQFNYEIRMRAPDGAPAPDFSRAPDCGIGLWVEVAGERFALIDRQSTPEMYPFDVYCAPEDLPEYPYGAYPAFADGAEEEGEGA